MLTELEKRAFNILKSFEDKKAKIEKLNYKIRKVAREEGEEYPCVTPIYEDFLVNLLDEVFTPTGIGLASYYIYECKFNPTGKNSGKIFVGKKIFPIRNVEELKEYYIYAKQRAVD
jgi:hypothetical protein